MHDEKDLLDTKGKWKIQLVVGTFLYYRRAVEPSVLTALNDITIVQSIPTSNMQLHLESDVTYLVLPRAKRRISRYFYLHAPPLPDNCFPKGWNTPIYVEWSALES